MRRRGRRERGGALVLALLILVLLHVVVAVATARAIAQQQAGQRSWERTVAFHAAEAGLAESVQRIAREDEDGDVATTELGEALVQVEMRRAEGFPGADVRELRARGSFRGTVEELSLVVRVGRPTGRGPARVELLSWRRGPGRAR